MKKEILIIIIFFFIIGCAYPKEQTTTISSLELVSLKLTSPVFQYDGKIPSQYTCDGANINPPLTISDVPKNAQSLALLMDDPDISDIAKKNFGIPVWDHWVVFNMPPSTKEIAEGAIPSGIVGKNTRGNLTYGGPCPPDREHRYFFKLYALDTTLNLLSGSTKAEVEKAMSGHILAQAELIGRYERK